MFKFHLSTRSKIHDYIVYFFLAVSILCIAIPIWLYINSWGGHLSAKQVDWDFFSTFMGGTLGPIIATLSLLVTTYIVYEFNVYQKDKNRKADGEQLQQTTINLFKEFRSPQMAASRSVAWKLKKKWDAESGASNNWRFRKALIEAMVNEKHVVLDDDNYISNEDLRAVNDIISFYTMLSLYQDNGHNIKALNYFYYPWWRAFLVELCKEVEELTCCCIVQNPALSLQGFDVGDYSDNMKMGNALRALDVICVFKGLPAVDLICGFDNAVMQG